MTIQTETALHSLLAGRNDDGLTGYTRDYAGCAARHYVSKIWSTRSSGPSLRFTTRLDTASSSTYTSRLSSASCWDAGIGLLVRSGLLWCTKMRS